MTSLLALFLMTSTACGYSPLLNHTLPNRGPETNAIENDSTPTCRFELMDHMDCADFVWVNEPRGAGQEGSARVYLWPKSMPGVYADHVLLNIDAMLWMPDMGHGSQKIKLTRVSSGVYDATEVMFVMGGDWEIHLQLKDIATGKVVDDQKIPYRVR